MDAKILPFSPRRGPRGADGAWSDQSRRLARATTTALPVEYGRGWYQEAAIKEHEPPSPPKDGA